MKHIPQTLKKKLARQMYEAHLEWYVECCGAVHFAANRKSASHRGIFAPEMERAKSLREIALDAIPQVANFFPSG